ncbi:hypothetical protein CFC21_087330 [Triticum aestivum]|uniref:Uncharacterized protein n=2 Tax=Triticum aestivum TaxID=4565 RepID=A0A3B6PIJ4_WHEAT|nr:tyrosine-sulfated glycopeptide receptor 1-like [Triticum aestivum]KAF7083552.1 hypothetical protein CFC21_087330 [Triticum aestivum]
MLPLHCSYMRHIRKLPMSSPGLALLLLISLASPTSSCTEQDKTSLLQFHAGLLPEGGLLAWQNHTDCCMWEGITCSAKGMVTDVSLASRSLQGHISPSLGNLTGLLRLDLSSNLLSGGLPPELLSSGSIIAIDVSVNRLEGEFQELAPASATPDRPLKVLNISSNLFTGPFPSTTWRVMRNMVVLSASNNSFTGKLPTDMCTSSPSLAVLELSHNQFSGRIWPVLGRCSMLKVLKAGFNNLSGTLPDELFNATSLELLSLPRNGLHGTLEGANIIKLSHLATLDLGDNNFNGNIPESVGQLQRLQELHLNDNMMSGELPSTLTNCTNLMTIDLKGNNFSGELAKVNFSKLPSLRILDLMSNTFSGTIPESIYSCRNLTALRLSSNKFHGELAEGLRNLTSLSFLSLGNNSLTNITKALKILGSSKNLTTLLIAHNFMYEVMPQDDTIKGFQNLQVFSINSCSLSGQIPRWLSKLTNLGALMLHDNQLTGSIPDWISNLNFLYFLQISNNSLTGEIPTALAQMPMLRSEKTGAHLDPRGFQLPIYLGPSLQISMDSAFRKVLDLSVNKLVGEIPREIGLLKAIWGLNLSSNLLSGEIPQSICNLTNLQVLDLSINHLSGTIPTALNDLHFLSEFNVSNNELQGPIPTGGQISTFQSSSFDGNPRLCGPLLNRYCDLAQAAPVPITSANRWSIEVIFSIAFGVFFGVGVLYDQLVLSKFYG